MVASETLEVKNIVNSLIEGNYYSSTGIEIYSIWIEQNSLNIRSSPADFITISGKGYSSRTVNGNNVTYAEFDLSKFNSDWFRITVSNKEGKYAWSNPFYKEDLF